MGIKEEKRNVSIDILGKKYNFSLEKSHEEYFYKAAKSLSNGMSELIKRDNVQWSNGKKYSEFDYLVFLSINLIVDALMSEANYKKNNEDILLNIRNNNFLLEDIIELKENAL